MGPLKPDTPLLLLCTSLDGFGRYVSVTLVPIKNHMLLQLAAYVALLVASKMSETCPLRMKSLGTLTGRMFTPLQVRASSRAGGGRGVTVAFCSVVVARRTKDPRISTMRGRSKSCLRWSSLHPFEPPNPSLY